MPSVDASIVFVPRFSTLVGETSFTTLPLDVSQFGGAQFQIWRGPIRVGSGPAGTFTVYLEESLDALTWVLGASSPTAHVIGDEETKLFSYSFRLRWFRVRIELAGTDPIVTCWAEGLLRGGGGGVWPTGAPPTAAAMQSLRAFAPRAAPPVRPPPAPAPAIARSAAPIEFGNKPHPLLDIPSITP